MWVEACIWIHAHGEQIRSIAVDVMDRVGNQCLVEHQADWVVSLPSNWIQRPTGAVRAATFPFEKMEPTSGLQRA